jgi:stress response protein YsnF
MILLRSRTQPHAPVVLRLIFHDVGRTSAVQSKPVDQPTSGQVEGPTGSVLSSDANADRTIPIVQEEAFVTKRSTAIEQVRVHTSVDTEEVLVRDAVTRESIEITRVPIEREVAEAPAVREEDGVTIVPVLEERLVVEKRLFLVEEVHIRRTATAEPVSFAATLRRTRVDVDRDDLTNPKESN